MSIRKGMIETPCVSIGPLLPYAYIHTGTPSCLVPLATPIYKTLSMCILHTVLYQSMYMLA